MQDESDVDEDGAELHGVEKHEHAVAKLPANVQNTQETHGGNVQVMKDYDFISLNESLYVHVTVF